MWSLARHALVLAACLLGCGTEDRPTASGTPAGAAATSPAAAPPGRPAEPLASNTPRATSWGARFTAPRGWTLTTSAGKDILGGPEPELHVGIVDTAGASAEAAVAAAWPQLRPGFDRSVKVALDRPARLGWEQEKRFDYETSPGEQLVVRAYARRKGDRWTVLLLHAPEPAFERRVEQIALVAESLRPAGYAPESFAGRSARALDDRRLRAIRDFAHHAREVAGIPGLAISVFTRDEVLLETGLGVRKLGARAAVDADTLFLVSLNTISLTTLLLARLIDEGRFTWETPARQVSPDFKVGDAGLTGQILMKHLACGCAGLPRQDLEWLFELQGATAKRALDLLAAARPTTALGETFQWSQLMPAAAGYIGGHAAYPEEELGKAYDEAMRTRVFEPLAMSATTLDLGRALRGNHAAGHTEDHRGAPATVTAAMLRTIIPLRPGGGLWSSVRDLRRYVQLELASGRLPDGRPYVSEAALLARRAKQVAIAEGEAYGIGLLIDTRYGVPYVHHGTYVYQGRGLRGYHGDLFWLPDHGIGGVILTNADSGGIVLRPFIRRILELVFDGEDEARADLVSAATQRKDRLARDRERLRVPPDAATVAKLAKRYTNAALGELEIIRRATATIFDFGEWRSAVGSRTYDDGTMSLVTVDPGASGFEVVVSTRGDQRALVLRDVQHEYVFVEAP